MARALVALVVVALLATGCASRASLRQTQEDVLALRRAHEAALRDLTSTAAQVRALDGRNVELEARLQQQSAEAAQLRARLDAAEQELNQAKAQLASQAAAIGTAATAAPPAPTSEPSPRRPGAIQPDDAQRGYDIAMANFRAREHGQAVLDFLDFIARYPSHPLAPSAQYWIGEAYYVQRDYRQALVEFQRVVDMAPASSTAADALLKIGFAHTNLRENSRAQQAWQRVVHDYPATESAGKARALLREHAARRP
jgi:tol-pal system protein YbgF